MTRCLIALATLLCLTFPVFAEEEAADTMPSSSPSIKQMVYITVTVEDQDAALKWYVDNLAMTVSMDFPYGEHGERWLTLTFPGQDAMKSPHLVLFKADHAYDKTVGLVHGPVNNIYLEVDDCAAMTEKLRAAGAVIQAEPTEMPYGIEAAWKDPDGNLFTMIQPSMAPM